MHDSAWLRRALGQQLESLGRAGLTHLPRVEVPQHPALAAQVPPAAVQRPAAAASQPRPLADADVGVRPAVAPVPRHPPSDDARIPSPSAVKGFAPVPAASKKRSTLSPEERRQTLAALAQAVAGCRRCDELCRTRTQTVFGVGDPQAKILFIGEAPGADEDKQGEPFVGRAGQLLTKIIEACHLRRDEVYICNILKCRPPGNRNPSPVEAANCREYLQGQLETVDPEYIVCWGSVAAQNLLGTTSPIGKMRGQFHAYGRAKVLCTYHPSYLLRNPAAKKDVWDDMKFLMRDMGVEL